MSNFNTKFKPNDVICSDHFYNGKLLIVLELKDDGKYRCEDMQNPDQKWLAYKTRGGYHADKPYNWRLATDEDYVKAISYWVYSSVIATESDYAPTVFTFDDNEISITAQDIGITLTPSEAIALRDAIDKYVQR